MTRPPARGAPPAGTTPLAAPGTDAPILDGWLWPPDLPRPESIATIRAGQARIRSPTPDPQYAGALVSSLRAAAQRVADIPVRQIAATLASTAATLVRQLDDAGVREVAANAALSPEMTREAIRGISESWTPAALDRLLRADFPDPRVLDGFVPEEGRAVRAVGGAATLHIGSGNVPGVAVTSMIRALLVKSAVLAKPGAGDVALTVRFARTLRTADPVLGAAVAVHYWPGADPAHDGWERTLLRLVDQAVVYGADETIESVRTRAPASTRLVEHPHRLGAAVVDPARAPGSAAAAARAAVLFDQRGCVSAHLFLVVGERDRAARWCRELADRLADLHHSLPPTSTASDSGPLSALHQLRGRLAMKRAASGTIEMWTPGDLLSPSDPSPPPITSGPALGASPAPATTAAWTVVLAPIEEFEPVGARTVWVVPVQDWKGCLAALAPMAPVLQTVGVAGIPTGATPAGAAPAGAAESELAESLFRIGATRIVPLAEMPFPTADWLHDGARPLGELVRWGEARPLAGDRP